jgi:hypothetical protein
MQGGLFGLIRHGGLATGETGVLPAAVFGVRRVVGMGCVFVRVFFVNTLIMGVIFAGLSAGLRIQRCNGKCFDGRRVGRIVLEVRRLGLARMRMVVLFMPVVVVVRMRMTFMIMMFGVGAVMSVLAVGMIMVVAVILAVVLGMIMRLEPMFMLLRLVGRDLIRACALDHVAADAVAIAAAARVAVARTATVGTVFALFFGLAMRAFVGFDQRLPVGDRNLIIIRMDFAEGEEAVTVAAILDEGRLQRRLYPRDLGEIDVAPQLFALGGLEIKLFDAVAANHNDPGLFRVGSIDQHFVGHFGTLDGGGRV